MFQTIPPEYVICPPLADHPVLENVFHPENIEGGYMWACRLVQRTIKEAGAYLSYFRVEDLAAAVPNVPQLPEMELLM
jgi:hypothetical protein